MEQVIQLFIQKIEVEGLHPQFLTPHQDPHMFMEVVLARWKQGLLGQVQEGLMFHLPLRLRLLFPQMHMAQVLRHLQPDQSKDLLACRPAEGLLPHALEVFLGAVTLIVPLDTICHFFRVISDLDQVEIAFMDTFIP